MTETGGVADRPASALQNQREGYATVKGRENTRFSWSRRGADPLEIDERGRRWRAAKFVLDGLHPDTKRMLVGGESRRVADAQSVSKDIRIH